MQRLEHQHDIETRVHCRDIFCAAIFESDIVGRIQCLIFRKLNRIHFQRKYRRGLLGHQAGLVRLAATELKHVCTL